MGADEMVYPDNVGLPVGGEDYYPYVMLEVHYNNEQKEKGVLLFD